MPARYAALPNRQSAQHAEQEMNDAFESDNEDVQESNPLEIRPASNPAASHANTDTYDFEREYDVPPPGSPPGPSTVALPNDFGNSNGLLPSSPVQVPAPRPSFLRRAAGAVLPFHYIRLPTGEPDRSRTADGVFANMMAKPSRPRAVFTEDGNIHMVPEDNQKEAPPSYADAQEDASPSYWETTVHAPSGFDLGSDMIIDDLPSGSVLTFAVNLFTSFFFQFVGFMLTYILHTSHAGRYGSRGGLGITLIQYGFYSRGENRDSSDSSTESSDPSLLSTSPQDNASANAVLNGSSRAWLSFLFMTIGWFLLLSSIVGFWRVKRWESSIRASSTSNVPVSPGDVERDIAIRQNIEQVFGVGYDENRYQERRGPRRSDREIVIPNETTLQAARFNRDLRDAGLL